MNNNELKIMVPNGWVINEEVMTDGSRVLTIKPNTTTAEYTTGHIRESLFKKVRVSELSLEDNFLKYVPKTEREKEFKKEVKKVIKAGVRDFWRPICDPSFDDDNGICYKPGEMPAVNKSYDWWEEKAKYFCPERGSRIGTKHEYIAFLAVLIKELIASGKSRTWAWNAVCNDSNELGHYCDSKDANDDFEPTGRRNVCGWFDLANSCKILAEDEEAFGFWSVGGYCNDYGDNLPLADMYHDYDRFKDNAFECGWLVLESWPED